MLKLIVVGAGALSKMKTKRAAQPSDIMFVDTLAEQSRPHCVKLCEMRNSRLHVDFKPPSALRLQNILNAASD